MGIPTAETAEYMPTRGDAALAPVYDIISNLPVGKVKIWTFTQADCNGDDDPTTAARSFAGRLRMKYPRKRFAGVVKVAIVMLESLGQPEGTEHLCHAERD